MIIEYNNLISDFILFNYNYKKMDIFLVNSISINYPHLYNSLLIINKFFLFYNINYLYITTTTLLFYSLNIIRIKLINKHI